MPFSMAVRDGGALAITTGYNRLNGRWLTQQREFLLEIVRDEWGFDGLVMTDWFAVAETTVSLGAGLDLEMPGPARAFGAALLAALEEGEVGVSDLDGAVGRLLGGFDRIGALDAPAPLDDPKEPTVADVSLLRQAAAESMVLLQNDGTLPLAGSTPARVAVLGPHAVSPAIMGGGSAQLTPHHVADFLSSFADACSPGTDIVYERGCEVTTSRRRGRWSPSCRLPTASGPTATPVATLKGRSRRPVR